MHDRQGTERIEKAIEIASAAWSEAHRGLPTNPMARTAAIPAIGVVAASLLSRPAEGGRDSKAEAVEAISKARLAWGRCNIEIPTNRMARTAEKAAIGILAAGILNAADLQRERAAAGQVEQES